MARPTAVPPAATQGLRKGYAGPMRRRGEGEEEAEEAEAAEAEKEEKREEREERAEESQCSIQNENPTTGGLGKSMLLRGREGAACIE